MDFLRSLSIPVWNVVNTLINQLDQEAFTCLLPHKNKIICFEIENSPPCYFQIFAEGLKMIASPGEQTIAVTFSGTLTALMAMIFHQHRITPGLRIKGDMELAKALYDTWQHIDLDWEGHIANWAGPHVAYAFSKSVSSVKNWTQAIFTQRSQDVATYLQNETQILPHPTEVTRFLQEVDILRHDVERFEAKLTLYQQCRDS